MSWEESFKSWGKGPGSSENEKMENTETAIRKAITAHAELSSMDISIIPQGSYKSRTNVRQNSDVDICVRLNSTFFPRYPAGKTQKDYYHKDSEISFSRFKTLVHLALGDYFGFDNVTPGSKAFDVHANTYRIDADVVPAFAYHYYHGDGLVDYIQPKGMAFNADGGARIVNWPHQTYENGKTKHENTGKRYKKMVRILKKLRDKMQLEKIAEAADVASFLIESLVYNVPNEGFNHETYTADVRWVLAHCFNQTKSDGSHATMKEVNERKLLFGSHQPWTLEKAHSFVSKAWDYLGFE